VTWGSYHVFGITTNTSLERKLIEFLGSCLLTAQIEGEKDRSEEKGGPVRLATGSQ
jgi:hypothetical protein